LVALEVNPTYKDEDGIARPVINIDRTDSSLVTEIFFMGLGGNPLANVIVRGIVAVCGDAITI